MTALEIVLIVAARWERVALRGRRVEFSNWRFSRNGVAGDPGIIQVNADPGPPFQFQNCTFSGNNDPLALGDVIIELANEALGE